MRVDEKRESCGLCCAWTSEREASASSMAAHLRPQTRAAHRRKASLSRGVRGMGKGDVGHVFISTLLVCAFLLFHFVFTLTRSYYIHSTPRVVPSCHLCPDSFFLIRIHTGATLSAPPPGGKVAPVCVRCHFWQLM